MIVYFQKIGTIEVITGGMFSGKTEELIRRVKRAQIAKQKLIVFKPAIDTRYDDNDVVSHSKSYFQAYPLQKIEDINSYNLDDIEVVAIDEAQFFGKEIVKVCESLAEQGKRVIVAGLDLDYMGRPFGSIPDLLAVAEHVTKTQAICTICGNPASRSQRIIASNELVVLGSDAQYEPRCRLHFHPEGEEKK
ncbi:thymidine kinase [bacterium]|nr:thymidine kinase [bacterium]